MKNLASGQIAIIIGICIAQALLAPGAWKLEDDAVTLRFHEPAQ